MTLDEAILHSEEKAEQLCGKCAEEHAQLAEWLKELKIRRETVDAEPVRHGHWIEQEVGNLDTYYTCSACKEDFCLIEGEPSDNLWNYCPNCGAKMDGE